METNNLIKSFKEDYSKELINVLKKQPNLFSRLGNFFIFLILISFLAASNFILYPESINENFHVTSFTNKYISGIITSNSDNLSKIKKGQKVKIFTDKKKNNFYNGTIVNIQHINDTAKLDISGNFNIILNSSTYIKIVYKQKMLSDEIFRKDVEN